MGKVFIIGAIIGFCMRVYELNVCESGKAKAKIVCVCVCACALISTIKNVNRFK